MGQSRLLDLAALVSHPNLVVDSERARSLARQMLPERACGWVSVCVSVWVNVQLGEAGALSRWGEHLMCLRPPPCPPQWGPHTQTFPTTYLVLAWWGLRRGSRWGSARRVMSEQWEKACTCSKEIQGRRRQRPWAAQRKVVGCKSHRAHACVCTCTFICVCACAPECVVVG